MALTKEEKQFKKEVIDYFIEKGFKQINRNNLVLDNRIVTFNCSAGTFGYKKVDDKHWYYPICDLRNFKIVVDEQGNKKISPKR